MAMPPDDLFFKQELELQRYADRRTTETLRLLNVSRRDLQSVIAATEWEKQRIGGLMDQIDGIILDMRRDLSQIPQSADALAGIVKAQQELVVPIITGTPGIQIEFNAVNMDTIRAFSRNELSKVTSIAVEEVQTVKSILFSRVGVQGLNPRQVARELAGPEGLFVRRFGIIENILRTEVSTVYNEQKLLSIIETNDKYDLELNKKILETVDDRRNHPISQVLNGQVQTPREKFRAKVSDVSKVAKRIKKSASPNSIFWPKKNEFYVGDRLPAHFRERGIIIPTDEPPNAPPSK